MKAPIVRLFARFRRDRRGVSAVEFALLLPVMLTLYITGNEISTAVAIDRKVTITARTVTDLVSRASTISTSNMSDILNASGSVIAPYIATKVAVTVSQVYIDNNSNAKVNWSCTFQGTARTVGTPVTLPSQLVTANSYLIWGEAQYSYTPSIGYMLSGTLNLKDQIYMAPRLSQSVTGPASC
jgi:Flp pilus assembly protein TadG